MSPNLLLSASLFHSHHIELQNYILKIYYVACILIVIFISPLAVFLAFTHLDNLYCWIILFAFQKQMLETYLAHITKCKFLLTSSTH